MPLKGRKDESDVLVSLLWADEGWPFSFFSFHLLLYYLYFWSLLGLLSLIIVVFLYLPPNLSVHSILKMFMYRQVQFINL